MTALLLCHGLILLIIVSNAVYLRWSGEANVRVAELPKVSILIPARNEEDNIKRLLSSLWMQDYDDLEVIVVDDASEDGTWDVLQKQADDRLITISGDGPPEGWVGKVHALYQATRQASGELFLFMDADAVFRQRDSLRRLVYRKVNCGSNCVLSGLPQYTDSGWALILTSLVPLAILSALPLALFPHTKTPSLSALNGQCWMIDAEDYKRYEPHSHHKDEVLEDVRIGRYLKQQGLTVHLQGLDTEVSVRMYRTFSEAWRGFRKNAYLLQGGRVLPFLLLHAAFWLIFVLAPLFGWPLLVTQYLIKGSADRLARLPLWVTMVAPFVLLCGALLQLDSAFAHWSNRVSWKGRDV